MAKTVPKKSVVVATDHTGAKVHGAVVRYLRGRDISVIPLAQCSADDSYADIAKEACSYIEKGDADSAVLIDQFGSAVASVANMFFGIVAMTVASPYMAHEITRKCNPDILCIPAEHKGGRAVGAKEAAAIVGEWLDTEFLEDVPAADRAKYEGRDDENRRIHLGVIDSLIGGRRRAHHRQDHAPSPSAAKPSADMLEHYDDCFDK